MDLEQADILEYYLRNVSGVTAVSVYDRTQDAVIVYRDNRSAVIRALAAFSFAQAKAMDLVPDHTTRALNREFEDKLAGVIARLCISKLFLPLPVTTVISIFRSLKYIQKGLAALFRGQRTVAVLDATANQSSMTGDSRRTAESVAAAVGVDEVYAEVLPELCPQGKGSRPDRHYDR